MSSSRCGRRLASGQEVRPHGGEERDGGRGLDDDRAPRRPGDAEVEPVDRHDLEDEVGDVGDDDDDERLAEVGHAPQHAVADEGDEHER